MGDGLGKNIVKFDNGRRYPRGNFEDDLAIIATHIPLRIDDHAGTVALSTAMFGNNTGAYATGIIEQASDTDMFSFSSSPGPITVTVTPVMSRQYTIGNNLDIKIDLVSTAGAVLVSSNPNGTSSATLTYQVLRAGPYYIRVAASFDPTVPSSNIYGSIGQYDVRTTRWYTVYQATMNSDPAFIISRPSMWAWGNPAQNTSDPKGQPVLGTVLTGTGLYTEPQAFRSLSLLIRQHF
jgi:hypothetical protein